ncbi:hypothetical protein CJU89_4876 [Yarrowia sp. B02]|nr:hypothetical protein CJU89_4876 [Yarrowia sp. B02]
MKSFYLLALQAIMVTAKEVSSPLTSLDVHTLSNSKDGKFSARWIWDLDFVSEDIQSGDHFTFTVDERAAVSILDFSVKDSSGKSVMTIKNSGNVFTATYTADGSLSGKFNFEAPFDRNKLVKAEKIDVTVKSGSKTLSDSVTIDPSLDVKGASVYGQRKEGMIGWKVRLPLTPWNRLEYTITLDGESTIKSIQDVKDNLVLQLSHDVNEFGEAGSMSLVDPKKYSQHHSISKASASGFTGRLFNLPAEVYNVDVSFPSHIKNIVESFNLKVEWKLWNDADSNEATRWISADHSGSGSRAAAYICETCVPVGRGFARLAPVPEQQTTESTTTPVSTASTTSTVSTTSEPSTSAPVTSETQSTSSTQSTTSQSSTSTTSTPETTPVSSTPETLSTTTSQSTTPTTSESTTSTTQSTTPMTSSTPSTTTSQSTSESSTQSTPEPQTSSTVSTTHIPPVPSNVIVTTISSKTVTLTVPCETEPVVSTEVKSTPEPVVSEPVKSTPEPVVSTPEPVKSEPVKSEPVSTPQPEPAKPTVESTPEPEIAESTPVPEPKPSTEPIKPTVTKPLYPMFTIPKFKTTPEVKPEPTPEVPVVSEPVVPVVSEPVVSEPVVSEPAIPVVPVESHPVGPSPSIPEQAPPQSEESLPPLPEQANSAASTKSSVALLMVSFAVLLV